MATPIPHPRLTTPADRSGPHRLLAAAGLAIGLAIAAPLPWNATAVAQISATTGEGITGRDFAGIRLGQTPVRGPLSFKSTRAALWQEGATQRMLLDGRVRATIGPYSFDAARAVVWLERIPTADGQEVQQVYVYFEDLGSPADPAGSATMSAKALPVRGIIVVEGGVGLAADLVTQGRPAGSGNQPARDVALLDTAEASLRRSLQRELAVGQPTGTPAPGDPLATGRPPTGIDTQPVPALDPSRRPPPSAAELTRRLAAAPGAPIFAKEGVITLAPGEVTFVSGEQENAIIASGGVTLQYVEVGAGRSLQIQAQRAVVFLEPGRPADLVRLSASQVRGIYLEGDVIASDGDYTLRGPQIYYDVQNNKAVVLDAVFWTYDEDRRLPLYVRADTIRQESSEQWIAKGVTFTNTAFFDPELSIGASKVTITRKQTPVSRSILGGDEGPETMMRTTIRANNITPRLAGVPVFYFPVYSGDPARPPITDFRIESLSSGDGAVKVTLNPLGILGFDREEGFRADLLTDFYFNRGPALGTKLEWQRPTAEGSFFGYMVPFDSGRDIMKSGAKLDREDDFRGVLLAEQRWKIDDKWTLFAEGAYLSDEAVIDGFFEDIGETGREVTSRAVARRLDENTSFTVEAKGSFNDFLVNEYLLTSQGYSVSKLPEALYVRQADDLLEGTSPGTLTWFHEYRAGRLGLELDEVLARDHGFRSNTLAQRALGVNANESLADRLRAAGYFEDEIHRFDTRQELVATLRAGPVNVTPFVVGRITGYDTQFEDFAPEDNDQVRGFGALGIRLATSIQRVYDQIDSALLDIHRIRHIIEPSITAWHAGTNVQGTDLPVYDDQVENLADGTIARFGVTQTIQTQRGGPGRWHNADLFVLSTDVVVSSGDTDSKSPIGRFFDYRPEYSNPGNYLVVDALWNVTDAFALTGSEVYDFDDNQSAMTAGGFLLRHSPTFITIGDARFLNAQDSTLLSLANSYELSNRYSLAAGASYNTNEGGFQAASFEIRRSFPTMTFGLGITYNDITGETGFGFVFRPAGAAGEARVSGIGLSDTAGLRSGVGGR